MKMLRNMPTAYKQVKKITAKLSDDKGDTLIEVLCALVIAALALTLLAISISTAARLASDSKTEMDATYTMEEALASASPSAETVGTVSVTTVDGDARPLTPEDREYSLSYTLAEDQPATIPIVSYVAEEEEA